MDVASPERSSKGTIIDSLDDIYTQHLKKILVKKKITNGNGAWEEEVLILFYFD